MNDCVLSDEALLRLLAEDVPAGDLTTATLGIGGAPARLEFRARRAMQVCATEEARRLFELGGASRCLVFSPSGTWAEADTLLLWAEGPAGALHRVWKSAQNLVEWASGVAGAAAALTKAAWPLPVACTRKNVPGTKSLSIKAIRAGGAIVHRLGLSETLLVFAEHRLFLDMPPADTINALRQRQPEKRVVVEVGEIEEAMTWAVAGAEILQLERFPPAAVTALRARLAEAGLKPLLVATGGVTAANAMNYAAAGADLIASSAPYSAPPADVATRFVRTAQGEQHG
ncbi:ModD protein [Pseudothauera nasutitermitis]|uniref:Putative pyrophosphorylase ModD n=1 Tax=Pseudothauera nasutitermitis TaxID=2565930 RepID=A0A4S4B1B3_9RHOO|nr:ModD protein [Pseudothauera nasutitermitis]THF64698.1 ModD protein [Pseudothauera nasutitermitis]